MSDAEFNNLCSHYKDTFEIHLRSIKQRDMLFYALLVIVAVFSMQIISADYIDAALRGYINKQLGIYVYKNSDLLGVLLWLFMFGFSSRYYQVVIQIERQYEYIHHLECLIGGKYPGTRAFSREGESYTRDYPLFSSWMWLLYTLVFPMIILAIVVVRIYYELIVCKSLGMSLVVSFVSFLLIGMSTILYIFKLHESVPRRCITSLTRGVHKILNHILLRH